MRIACIGTSRLKVEPHLRDQGRSRSKALEQRDFPFPAGAIGDPPRVKPQANPHARGKGGEHRAHALEIPRIAGSRKRTAACSISGSKFRRIARKVQVAVRVDERDSLHHSDRPPFSKPISEQIT